MKNNRLVDYSSLYQEIWDELHGLLPDGWKNVVLYAAYTSGSFSIKYFLRTTDGYIDCYNSGVSKSILIERFTNIHRKILQVRSGLLEKERWNVLTLIVSEDGEIQAQHDYRNIEDDFIEYERVWKKRYLS